MSDVTLEKAIDPLGSKVHIRALVDGECHERTMDVLCDADYEDLLAAEHLWERGDHEGTVERLFPGTFASR